MSSRSNSPDPNLPEVNLPEFEDNLDLDFEAIFADAIADIVQNKGGPQTQPLGKTEITQILQRTLSIAMSSRRPPVKLNVRKLQEPNLDSLFLNLSPLQLEEPQSERSTLGSFKVKPQEANPQEPSTPEPMVDGTADPTVDNSQHQPPQESSAQRPADQLSEEARSKSDFPKSVVSDTADPSAASDVGVELSWPILSPEELDLPAQAFTQPNPTQPNPSAQESLNLATSYLEIPYVDTPHLETPNPEEASQLETPHLETPNPEVSGSKISHPGTFTPKPPDPALAQLESFLGAAGFRFPAVELSDIELPELGLNDNSPPPTPETSSPSYPFPNCPLSVATQLQDVQSLMGDLVTQDNYLAQQHQELHATLQNMLGDLVDADSPLLADCLGAARHLKAQIQRTQKTLRQQRQTLQQLHSSWFDIQMLPLQDLFQPLADWGNQLVLAQEKFAPGRVTPNINFELRGSETQIDQRLFLRLRQPLTELFRHFFLQIFRSSAKEINSALQQVQFQLWGSTWGQQVWIELRHPGTPLELDSYLFQLNTQIQALHGTVHYDPMGESTALTLRLPRFLPIGQLLLIKVEEQLLAFPLNTLTQVITVEASDLFWQQGKPYYQLPHALVPVYPLKQCLQLAAKEVFEPKTDFGEKVSLVCVGFDDRQVALQVDELLQEQELTIRASTNLNKAQTPSYVCGYGLLNEDKLVPILDPAPLLERLETHFSA